MVIKSKKKNFRKNFLKKKTLKVYRGGTIYNINENVVNNVRSNYQIISNKELEMLKKRKKTISNKNIYENMRNATSPYVIMSKSTIPQNNFNRQQKYLKSIQGVVHSPKTGITAAEINEFHKVYNKERAMSVNKIRELKGYRKKVNNNLVFPGNKGSQKRTEPVYQNLLATTSNPNPNPNSVLVRQGSNFFTVPFNTTTLPYNNDIYNEPYNNGIGIYSKA